MEKNKKKITAGVDEVGRGPLAGPVTAAVVILDPEKPIEGLRDSKLLSPTKRERMADQIILNALDYCIGSASVQEIDEINILQASLLAMQRAILGLKCRPEEVLIDGIHCPDVPYAMQGIIGGDKMIPEISAASIIAKVHRDAYMISLDEIYPGYGFAQHKGYGTKVHMTALNTLGVTPVHRKSFAPVRKLLVETT